MNIQQVIYALKVYEYHSFTEAAKSLYISQPRLSQAIRELEEELGFEIFMRSRKGISGPTVKGLEFIDQARILLRQFSALESLKERSASSLQLCSTLLVPAQDAFLALCNETCKGSKCNINLWFCGCYEATERIKSMASEVGVVALLDDQFEEWLHYFKSNNINYTELYASNIVVTVSKSSPLAGYDLIKEEDLTGYTYVAENCTRMNDNTARINDLLDKTCQGSCITVSNTDMMYSLIGKKMLDKAFIFEPISPDQATLDRYDLVSVPFEDTTLKAHIGYICHSDRKLSNPAERYIELLKEMLSA